MKNLEVEENSIISIIKFLPVIIIFAGVVFFISLIYQHYEKEYNINKKFLEEQYIQDEKTRIKSHLTSVSQYINNQIRNSEINLKKKIKRQVDNAYNIAQNIYEKNKDTKTKEEITFLIKEALRPIRFENYRGYFFIYQMDGKNIMHGGNPNLEGKPLWDYQDAKGTFLLREMNRILQAHNQTFYSWYWVKPGGDKTQYKKIGYFKKFAPYDFFIGTGEYVVDFEKQIKKEAIEYIKQYKMEDYNYIGVVDFHGTFVYHPLDQIRGENVFTNDRFRFSKDSYYDLINSLEEKENYHTINLDVHGINDFKTIYSLKLDQLGIILSSGFRHSNIKDVIEKRKQALDTQKEEYINKVLIYASILGVVFLLISFSVSRILSRKFLNYKRQVHSKIRENIRKHDLLVEAQEVARIGDWVLDIKTMKAHWSKEVLKIIGQDENLDDAGPEFLKGIMFEEDWQAFEDSMQNCILNGTEHYAIYRVRHSDGSVVWVECRGRYKSNDNTIVGTVQDITENKKLEEEKLEKEKLIFEQNKLAMMGEMVGNIAHQWRQPLSVITTASTGVIFKKEMNMLSDDFVVQEMEIINDQAQYISRTIDDFRDFIKGDRLEVEFTLQSNIDSFLSLVYATSKNNDIEIITSIDDSTIKGFPNELIQCYMNIFNNAKDALVLNNSDERFVFINVVTTNNEVIIRFKDNAGGIDDNIIEKIFIPYFTTKHQSQGTGLGLSMTHKLITEGMNGVIDVKNVEYTYKDVLYKGAEFTITLPK